MLMLSTLNSLNLLDTSLYHRLLDRTCIATVAMLAGDIGQSGLVPGRAPVHSDPDFSMSLATSLSQIPLPGAPIGGGSKSRNNPPRPAGRAGPRGGGSPKFFSETPTLFAQCSAPHISLYIAPRYIAQVYTRDATHRPTATSTPGRGTFLSLLSEIRGFRHFSGFFGENRGGDCGKSSKKSKKCEICQISRNFRKKVKKSEKYPPPARAGGGFFGVFDPPGGVKFDEI